MTPEQSWRAVGDDGLISSTASCREAGVPSCGRWLKPRLCTLPIAPWMPWPLPSSQVVKSPRFEFLGCWHIWLHRLRYSAARHGEFHNECHDNAIPDFLISLVMASILYRSL